MERQICQYLTTKQKEIWPLGWIQLSFGPNCLVDLRRACAATVAIEFVLNYFRSIKAKCLPGSWGVPARANEAQPFFISETRFDADYCGL